MNQKTILSSIEIKGTGLHSGENITVKLEPAMENSGIVFHRSDLVEKPLKALASNVVNTKRCTVLGNDEFKISTVEHILSALYALNIDNINIFVNGAEMPAMDGSSAVFYNTLKSCGIKELSCPRKEICLTSPIFEIINDSILIALPSKERKFTVVLDYPGTLLGTELCSFNLDKDSYIDKVAPSRTFAFMHEVQMLLDNNLAKGGDFNNALVISEDSYSSPLKHENEPVWHKCLDLIGDMSLCGKVLLSHIVAIKPGHTINTKLALKLEKAEA